MDAKSIYDDVSFGNDRVLAEKYFAKMLNQIVNGEVVSIQCIDRGELVDYLTVRKIAILLHLEPDNDFRSDATSVRRRVKNLLDKHPRCEYVVTFNKDTQGIFRIMEDLEEEK